MKGHASHIQIFYTDPVKIKRNNIPAHPCPDVLPQLPVAFNIIKAHSLVLEGGHKEASVRTVLPDICSSRNIIYFALYMSERVAMMKDE